MTIRIEVTNPAEHQPNELRAVAVFLNNLAEDRESGRIAGVDFPTMVPAPIPKPEPVAPVVEVAKAPTPLPPVPEAGNTAPSASAPMTPPPAPVADVPPAPTTLSGVDLDSAGLPWDGRIHAESKNKISNGTWRKKKNVDPALVTEVEARLRELVAIPPAPAAPAVVMPPVADPVPPAPVAPVVEPVPPAPVADPVPPAPAAPATPATVTVADVFKFATAAEKNGSLNGETRSAALLSLGFNSMVELSTRPDMAAQVIETFKQYGAE